MGEFVHAIMPAERPMSLDDLAETLVRSPAMQAALAWWNQGEPRREQWGQLGCRNGSCCLPAGFGLEEHPQLVHVVHKFKVLAFLQDKVIRNLVTAVAVDAAHIVDADRILWVSDYGLSCLPLDEDFDACERLVRSHPNYVELQHDRIYDHEEIRAIPDSNFEYMLQSLAT